MSSDGKDKSHKVVRISNTGEKAASGETFDEALSDVGFEAAAVGRKKVSQGKRRQRLKKRAYQNPDK